MKLCTECCKNPWPFVLVALIAGVATFVTWLTLGLSQTDLLLQALGSAGVFLAVTVTLTHYVLSCLRRHCRHRVGGLAASHRCQSES